MGVGYLEVSPSILSKSPYGMAFLSPVDGRGNFSVFGIFRQRKRGQVRKTYKFAGILCYAGSGKSSGKIVDAFIEKGITEEDLNTSVQSYIALADKLTSLVNVPMCELATFVLSSLTCEEKAVANSDVRRAWKLFSRCKIANQESEEEYIERKLESEMQEPTFAHFDRRRKEFSSWWIEVPELIQIKCPQPERLLPETQAASALEKIENHHKVWEVELARRISTRANYERFAGMARHMALWFLFAENIRNNRKLAATFLVAYRDILQAHQNGKILTPQLPVLGTVLGNTHAKCELFGVCKGQKIQEFPLISKRNTCNVCNAPAESLPQGKTAISCCDKLGRGKLGDKIIQKALGDLIFNYWEVYIPEGVLFSIRYALSKALRCFFAHAMNNLCWNVKPSIATVNEMIESLLFTVTETIKRRNTLRKGDKVEELLSVTPLKDAFFETIKAYCGAQICEQDLQSICRLFIAGYEDSFVLGETRVLEPEKSVKVFEGCEAKLEWIHNLVLAPVVADRVKYKWQFLGRDAKEKLLTCGRPMLNHVILSTYRETMGMIVRMRCKKDGTRDLNCLFGCDNLHCACHNLSTFQPHFMSTIPTVFRPMSSYLVYKPDGYEENKGALMLNYQLCIDRDGLAIKEVISGERDGLVHDKFRDQCKGFKACKRLHALSVATYKRLYLAMKMKIVQEYNDASVVQENVLNGYYYRDTCGGCGWEEIGCDHYKRCGGCLEVCYCSAQCQRRHWAEGHRGTCSRVFVQPQKKLRIAV